MKIDLSKMATFGVAGNFTGHLEQAGEAVDFTNVKTKEAKAPKAVFPTFIPNLKEGDAAVTPRFQVYSHLTATPLSFLMVSRNYRLSLSAQLFAI